MTRIIGVRFKPAGKIYYFDRGTLEIQVDDGVIVETARGLEYGNVVSIPELEELPGDGPIKPVVRKATIRDMVQLERNKEREKSAFDICLKKIEKYKCDMKLLRAEYTFDRNKIVFFFTAEGRVDFRELVKELASVFHTRIELRQVGVRDKAKQVSGIGPCGRPLCCATFLAEFAPVSIKMAKNQGLSLNPTKISGACGRLMCCLRYENDQYSGNRNRKNNKPAPNRNVFRIGMKVVTDDGAGQIVYVNAQKHTVKVQLKGEGHKILSWDAVELEEND
ncbi:MAG: stage 0 sporulation family protein [Dialister sp.]|nr:stage 0 sporulation family protein [Dialister sp.]